MKLIYNFINNLSNFKIDENKIKNLISIIENTLNLPYEIMEFSIVINNSNQELNHKFGEKNKDTNVLSFANYNLLEKKEKISELEIGDIIFSNQKLMEEAKIQNKNPEDHFLHLLTHGILHLIGYDHEKKADALKMENLEINILSKININNPYE
jgi:probable rRNA maturation factor